ncbi:MAG: hypothetical protein A2Y38_22620 [Spirochaetes bacterium GWB1_59_5]|nr:MAG: hypothetical protein A2Y38_22620 [Spirochaetes bacterium GWB1_59_5]
MKLVYVAGPLFGPDDWAIRRNIHHAVSLGFAVAQLGCYPVIPHANTGAWFMGTMTSEFWYAGTLALLGRCDAGILVPGWEDSKGTRAEIEEAKRLGIPVFDRIEELKAWPVAQELLANCPTCSPQAKERAAARVEAMLKAKGD